MGSWSVHCGISNIAITSGNECVLLPLKKNNGFGYQPNLPATLPIFGTYDDYGGLENIQKDENTKLIEEHFGITIEEFVVYFVDGKHTYNRGEYKEVLDKIKNPSEVEDWNFMFIDKKVYDFMSTNFINSIDSLRLGDSSILKLLDFKHEGESEGVDEHLYSHSGKKFISNGRSLKTWDGQSIFYFNDSDRQYSLLNHIDLSDDKLWVGTKNMYQLWEHLDDSICKELLLQIVGVSVYDLNGSLDILRKFYIKQGRDTSEIDELVGKEPEPKTLKDKYKRDFRLHGKLLSDLNTISRNLYPMSGYFKENILHLTPQCGEHGRHQIILDKFSEINKSYINQYE